MVDPVLPGGGLYAADGIPVQQLHQAWQNRDLQAFESCGEQMMPAAVLAQPCEVLFPCARENTITPTVAAQFQGRFVGEGANGPTQPAAYDALMAKGVEFSPDILANSGGVTCSYFEWLQNRQEHYWPRERVLDEFQAKLVAATDRLRAYSPRRPSIGASPRTCLASTK